jgi:hypothetical protein
MAMIKTTTKYVKPESGMTPRLDTDAASNNTSQIESKPANGGVIRAKRRRNIGASHAANGTAPLPKHRVANTPPIASHTNGVILRARNLSRTALKMLQAFLEAKVAEII